MLVIVIAGLGALLLRRAAGRAEAARATLERRFRTVFEHHLMPLVIGRRDGRVLEANDAWLKLLGCTKAQLASGELRWTEIIAPESSGQTEADLRTARETGRFGPVEKEYVRADGRRVPVLVGGSELPGEPGTSMVFAVDLTEQKRMERELRRSEARMGRLWESNIIGVAHSDAAGAILDANDRVLDMLGYTRDELRAGRLLWNDLTPPEHLPSDARGIAEARARGACTPYEKAYVRRDGRRVPVLIGYALVEGTADQFVCFLHDLTEQKRAEQALADQVTKAITDHASAALFIVDEHGSCTFMNPAAERMTGFSFAEAEGRSVHALVHHHRADGRPFPIEECEIHRALTDGAEARAREEVFFRKTGEAFPVVCSVSRIEQPGRPARALLEARDVTEQARAAAEREMLLDSERAARAEAERESRAKDEFVATLSHELRTPLNAMLGWTALARRPDQAAAQVDRALSVVERNGRLLARLISDLLDVSRIAAGKLRVELAPIGLDGVVEAALDTMREAAEARGIALTAEIERADAAVLGDAARMHQVVVNLVGNAIKFTPRGGRVAVALSWTSDVARLSVRDTGQGIEPDLLPHLFERFRQGESSAARHHGGLGLGLAIVKQTVELHRGTVRVESDGAGRGARFTVEIPRAVRRVVAPEPPPSRRPRLVGARVLVVDDEPDARELVKRLLEEQGAAVVTAASAAEALDRLEAAPLDVVVSDIGMPGMDGYEMMRRARAAAVAKAVPAVALTAYARPEDQQRALAAGYQGHLAKPVEPAELLATLEKVIRLDLSGR